ncbi:MULTISPECIES: EamA family transporter [unclassified Rhodococcus (in: high G+C Gram-positive bacteria)]|uniref:EamA family transporter n=1 Tax=unclassified Rhodococcus (in: high G+C Gram-positive bacteria) TaxID=192944 RepID=UPI002898B559|nr:MULTISPECIES: EamA family transporter [unclassified Rhodococcus (in: high G+C Gram-positive bacteria)]
MGTAAAFVGWFTETRHCRLDALSAWTFLAPVVGIILGSLLFGERPTGWSAAGLLAVLASMWIVLRPRPERSGT